MVRNIPITRDKYREVTVLGGDMEAIEYRKAAIIVEEYPTKNSEASRTVLVLNFDERRALIEALQAIDV